MIAADGACALHAGVAAAFTCPRCGAYGCSECERRTRPSAYPMCPECWERRASFQAKNTHKSDMALPNAAVALGVLGLVPFVWPAWIGAVVVALVARSRLAPGPHPGRRRAAVGLVLAPCGLLVTVVSFYLLLAGWWARL